MELEEFAAPGVTTFLGLALVSCGYAVLFLVIWALLRLCQASSTAALKYTILLHHLVVGPGALIGVIFDPALWEALECFGCADAAALLLRDPAGPCGAALALTPVTLGYMLFDLVLISHWDMSSKGDKQMAIMMVCHHVLSLVSWPFALVFDFCARYVLVLLAYEVSSIFLVVKWHLTAAGEKQGVAFMLNGALFTASFLLVRVAGALPQLRALIRAPPWTASAEDYQIYWWMPLGSTFLILPHLLNFYWGYKVFTGALALLRGKRKNRDAVQQKEALLPSDAASSPTDSSSSSSSSDGEE